MSDTTSLPPIGARKVVSEGQGDGVVLAEHPLAICEVALVQEIARSNQPEDVGTRGETHSLRSNTTATMGS